MAQAKFEDHLPTSNPLDVKPMKSMQEVIGELMAMGIDPLTKKNTLGLDFVDMQHHDSYDYIKPEQFDLKGRAVFITGASRGLGRAIAISYAKAGASYIGIGARSSLDEIKKEVEEAAKGAGRALPKVLALKLDVTNRESVAQSAKEVESAFGRCDILINNSGYMEKQVRIMEADPDDWWQCWTVNIFGTFLTTRAFLPLLLSCSDSLKTIVNMSSTWGHTKLSGGSGYQLTKFATMRFSELCNAEYGNQGLLSYHIHPGSVKTDLANALAPEMQQFLIDAPESEFSPQYLSNRQWRKTSAGALEAFQVHSELNVLTHITLSDA